MNFNEYMIKATETAIYPTALKTSFGPAYLAMKLCGEAAELWQALDSINWLKESGDLLWYSSQLALEFGIYEIKFPTDHTHWNAEDSPAIMILACEIAEYIGKLYRDRGGIIEHVDRLFVNDKLDDILICLDFAARQHGIALEQVAEMNLQKLADRKKRNMLHGSGDNR